MNRQLITYRGSVCWALLGLLLLMPCGARADDSAIVLTETPCFARAVASGTMPPVAERVPAVPLITDPEAIGRQYGRSGGRLRMLMARDKDVRQIGVYGYARLVGYDGDFHLQPDILESYDVDEGRIFTFHLRPGHRWSDGAPFTAEDFRFYWQDIALNPKVSPGGPPPVMRVDGQLPVFEVLDPLTVRYTWDRPNPMFLRALAGPTPLYIYMPAHYLKQLHADYADPAALAARVEASGKRSWASLINDKDKAAKLENPDLPLLQPWVLEGGDVGMRMVFRRNPYFHRIDAHGVQLPYLDRIVIDIADAKLIPAKVAAGESDLQARYLRFEDLALLYRGADEGGYRVDLWIDGRGSMLALYPNLNVDDPVWRKVWRDVRVRRALSLAIDREELNEVVFFGLGRPAANSLLPESTLYDPAAAGAYSRFDLKAAGMLLDQAGLHRESDRGMRHLPDGRPMTIIVESAGESTLENNMLLLIRDSFARLGIKLLIRPSQRDLFRNRVYAGQAMMSVWTGLDNGLADPSMPPDELAPVRQDSLEWPKWGQHHETHGMSGEPPSLAAATALMDLYDQWENNTDAVARQDIWRRMQALFTDNVFTIGTVNQVPQPVTVADGLRNVPEQAVYSWEPGAYFGVERMDLFFWTNGKGR